MEHTSELWKRAQRDGRRLAEDCPGLTEEALDKEVELQLRLLAAAGKPITPADDYRQGLFAGYQSAEKEGTHAITELPARGEALQDLRGSQDRFEHGFS